MTDAHRFGGQVVVLALAAAATLGACTGQIGERESDVAPIAIDPAPATLHRLTRAQYQNAIHDLLGTAITVPTAIEPDVESGGFATVGGAVGGISRRGVEQYESAALAVATQAMAPGPAREDLVACSPKGSTDELCARGFLERFGRSAWRRSLAEDELARLTTLATTASSTLGDFHQGLVYAIAALLQSPYFLFRVELGSADAEHAGLRRYHGDELASRLSFFLWNTIPDSSLLDAAARGDLESDERFAASVDRLLGSPRARHAVRNFFAERLGLSALDDLSKDTVVYPAMSADLGPLAREETLRDVDQLLMVEEGDYRDLFTLQRTFVDRKLASLYGIAAPSLDGFGLADLPESGVRRGLLGHASLLAIYAHPTSSSATLRGKFIREVLLCAKVPPPPANVNTALPDPKESGPTLRDRLKVHESQPFCASCHAAMDSLGLGLERFDGIGAYRTHENGAPIDASGEIDGVAFDGATSLGTAVAQHPDLGPCLVRHVVRYAIGESETPGMEAELRRLSREFADQGYRLPKLLRAVALSPAFRTATENP
jgi:hypothetical protein